MKKVVLTLAILLISLASAFASFAQAQAPDRAPAAAATHSKPHGYRVHVRQRPVECQPRRWQRYTPHRRPRHQARPAFFTRRPMDRFHRRVRRQIERVCDFSERRHAAPRHLSRRPGHRHRMDSRRQKYPLRLATRELPNGTLALFTVPVAGGFPTKVPLPIGWEGSYSPDGKFLAYRPTPFALRQLEPLSRRHLSAHLDRKSRGFQHRETPPRRLERSQSALGRRHDLFPLGPQRRLHALRLRHEIQKETQIIENTGLPIKSADAGPGAIVYEQFGSLHLYDLATHHQQPVQVRIDPTSSKSVPILKKSRNTSTTPRFRPPACAPYSKPTAKSHRPRGKRRHSQHHQFSRRRRPRPRLVSRWKNHRLFFRRVRRIRAAPPRAKWLGRSPQNHLGIPPSFFYGITWSPDSKKIAYTDKWLNLWYLDLDKPTPVKIDTDYFDARASIPLGLPTIAGSLTPSSFPAISAPSSSIR